MDATYIRWTEHPEGLDGEMKNGQRVTLRRAGELTKVTLVKDGRTCGLTMRAGDKCPPERRLVAEERMVRVAWKSVMLGELLGCHPADVSKTTEARLMDGDAIPPEAFDKWRQENRWP